MTALLEAPVSTATGTTTRSWLRRNRGALLLGAALLVVLLGLVLTSGVGRSGSLDPDSYEQNGGHGLAVLLEQQGVHVERVGDVPAATKDLPEDATVFVVNPALLSPEELSDLQGAERHLVLAGAGPGTAEQLGVDVHVDDQVDEKTRDPGCGDPAALAAGSVRIGGFAFASSDDHARVCYGRTVVVLPDQDLVLVGDAKALSNQRLGDEGNAELGLQLLAQGGTVRWLVPDPSRPDLGERPLKSLGDLVPSWVRASEYWLLVVIAFLVVWRGRRLGRVVPEPLPVVVRAAETVEGRARLYRAAGARGAAAEALRSGARDRLSARLGAGRHPTPEALVDLVAERTSRAATDVHALLYGPPPVDDAALVLLARALDALALEVSGS